MWRRIPQASEKDYVLLCTNKAGLQKVVAWTLRETHSVSLEGSFKESSNLSAVTGTGESFAPKAKAGRLFLELSAAPQYVALGTAVLKSP